MNKSKNICFIYTEANGIHNTNEDVSKKILFNFARLVKINYEIGYIENNNFISTKVIENYIKPRCMTINDNNIMNLCNNEGIEIEDIINEFKNNLLDVQIIVSHNIDFHLRTIMAEFVRYNISFTFSNFIIIDNISFYHSLNNPDIEFLYNTLYKKKENNLEMIKLSFLKLYDNYINSI
jgi:uncharacterized protein YvpB